MAIKHHLFVVRGFLRNRLSATHHLDECGAVSHPWKSEISAWTVGAGEQRWDQVQQVSHRVQKLDIKQRQRLWERQQINSWAAKTTQIQTAPNAETEKGNIKMLFCKLNLKAEQSSRLYKSNFSSFVMSIFIQ